MLAMDKSTCTGHVLDAEKPARCSHLQFLGLAMAIVAPAASDAAMSSISQSNVLKPARPGRLLEGQSPGRRYPSYCCIRLGQG